MQLDTALGISTSQSSSSLRVSKASRSLHSLFVLLLVLLRLFRTSEPPLLLQTHPPNFDLIQWTPSLPSSPAPSSTRMLRGSILSRLRRNRAAPVLAESMPIVLLHRQSLGRCSS
ncbi:hypothetical protein BDN72DRAFT_210849 [Pluteus cervinus]|uniref:Uncharacterized protein n=1 Tax=Pluteus cervinus TaxID=181527 RepID=A0ACD3B5F2_9AGAR|nr:hypothetical protein BDN72DRAFT_210849 [Pluteus cervinus]